MHETTDDLQRMQHLLDDSHERAGAHLKSIITDERLLTAAEICERLPGMRLLALATVSSAGRPIVSPVDGILYRGDFWFGSAPNSLKFRHIAHDPRVSATHLPGEELAVTVHGTAHRVDADDTRFDGFADVCVEIYGEEWRNWGEGAAYARIEAERLFTFHLDPDEQG
ncbi:MAG: pyridoxamine 5'-phosphate oxidase family protein [Acidimicrobiales bacterium]